MAYYIYTAGNPSVSQAEKLEMIAPSETEAQRERYSILRQVFDDYFKDEVSTKEVEATIHADPANLPINLMARWLAEREVCIMDAETGLAMSSNYWSKEKESFSIDFYDFDVVNGMTDGGEVTDDPVFQHLVIKNEFTHYAYQVEPLANGEACEHYSLGYKIEEGTFQPCVTVLDTEHPVRHAAANR